MGFRRKAKKTVRKYANKRFAKRVVKKVGSKFIPGLNVVSTADDVYWLGNNVYRILKNRQRVESNRTKKGMMDDARNNSARSSGNRRKRYGIDDWY